MVEWYPPIICTYCAKPIIREEVGWRSDERDPNVDRVKCPESPQAEPANRKHVPGPVT